MKKLIVAGVLWMGLVSGAKADSLFGEFQRLPDDIERGFSLGADFGIMSITGIAGKTTPGNTVNNPGFQLTLTLGYDLMKYFSIEAISTVGINSAATNDPVLQGGLNTMLVNVAGKFQLPIERWYPFVSIGPGLAITEPDVVAGQNNKLNFLANVGVEYYTYLRHYSLFARVTYYYIDLPLDAITVGGGLKYTF